MQVPQLDKLAHDEVCQTQEHVAVLGEHPFGIQRLIEVYVFVLCNKKKYLFAICKIGRAKNQRWTK